MKKVSLISSNQSSLERKSKKRSLNQGDKKLSYNKINPESTITIANPRNGTITPINNNCRQLDVKHKCMTNNSKHLGSPSTSDRANSELDSKCMNRFTKLASQNNQRIIKSIKNKKLTIDSNSSNLCIPQYGNLIPIKNSELRK